MVQTRAQVKSGSIKLPEVHEAKKKLIPHIKPENSVQSTCPTPPTCHLRPIHHIPNIDPGLSTNTLLPVPIPRIGQGRAGIRRRPKVAPPIPKVIQTPIPLKPMPTLRTVQPLTEHAVQSQDSAQMQHEVPIMPKPLIQPTPASIKTPAEPRLDPRPIPSYHEPLLRPSPRPQDDMKDNSKDLQDLDRQKNRI